MSKIKLIIAIVALAVVGYFVFQDKIEAFELPQLMSDKEPVEEKPKADVRRRIEDGVLKSDAEFIDGKRNGIANNYYSNGTVHTNMYYKDDLKHGDATWFYRSGEPYRITPYVSGKKDGIQKKYYEDGALMVEIPYENGKLITGTKEYWETGTVKTGYPEIIIDQNNGKLLVISVQPFVKKATYYAMVSHEGKLIKVVGTEQKKEAYIDLSNYSGECTVCVAYKTKMGNKKLEVRMVQL